MYIIFTLVHVVDRSLAADACLWGCRLIPLLQRDVCLWAIKGYIMIANVGKEWSLQLIGSGTLEGSLLKGVLD